MKPGLERFCVNPKCPFFRIGVNPYHAPSQYHVTNFGLVPDNQPLFVNTEFAHGIRKSEAKSHNADPYHVITSWEKETRHILSAVVMGVHVQGHVCGTCYEMFNIIDSISKAAHK